MLIKQNPNEVALLRITREILEKAEKEQSEKKLDSIKQSQDKIKMEEKERQQQGIELENKQEVLQEVTLKRKIEEREPSKSSQEHIEILQEKVSIQVRPTRKSQVDARLPIQEKEKEKEEQTREQKEDIEMDGKESRQGSTIEEKERQKRRRPEIEEEIDIVGVPLEESIWAPSKRSCSQDNTLLANIPAHNVPGKTKEERIKFINWSLKNNEHVKDIREVFKRGNLWIEVDFNCEYGRSKAIYRINKKESDWYKMIAEEKSEEMKGKQRKYNEEYLRKRNDTSKTREKDYEWEGNKAKKNQDCHKTDVVSDIKNYLTIWDLPTNINKKEQEYICRRFKDAHIVRIKRSKFKALAVVQIEKTNEEDIPWAIPVNNNKLVRVTKGEEDHEARKKQREYTAKLTELSGNASEVLLLRSLKSKGAKSVYIPPNRNGNQRRTATIIFATEKEMKAAQSKPIMYNNFRVYWINKEKRETRRRERSREEREERGRSWDRFSQSSKIGESKNREGNQRSKTYMNNGRNNETSRIREWVTEERNDTQDHNVENQSRYKDMNKKEEEGLEKRIAKVKA